MLKLEVGKFYMCANGGVVEILDSCNDTFLDDDSNLYLKDGKLHHNKDSKYDLIAEIPKELHQHLIKEVMNYWQDEDFRKTVNSVYGGEK